MILTVKDAKERFKEILKVLEDCKDDAPVLWNVEERLCDDFYDMTIDVDSVGDTWLKIS